MWSSAFSVLARETVLAIWTVLGRQQMLLENGEAMVQDASVVCTAATHAKTTPCRFAASLLAVNTKNSLDSDVK